MSKWDRRRLRWRRTLQSRQRRWKATASHAFESARRWLTRAMWSLS